jgi:hypothetical protein
MAMILEKRSVPAEASKCRARAEKVKAARAQRPTSFSAASS